MKVYIFKDVTQQIPGWRKWGKQICLIFHAKDIEKAIQCFESKYPEHCSKGKMKSTISIGIIK